jgi:hypothetical protein
VEIDPPALGRIVRLDDSIAGLSIIANLNFSVVTQLFFAIGFGHVFD